MHLKGTVVAVMLAIPALLHAQPAARRESLFVVNASGQPVPFASVSVKGGTARVTNTDGVIVINTHDDTLNLLVRRMGFEPFQGKVGRTADGSAFHVTLAPTSQALKKVFVNARATQSPLERNGFYDRMLEVQHGAPTGEFFTPEDLEARSSAKISQFLYASRFAKISQYNERGRQRAIIYGRNGCVMSIIVDGIVIRNLLGDTKEQHGDPRDSDWGTYGKQRTTIDDMVNGQEVMAIEVYPNVANAPMSIASKVMGSACGVVAIWTGGR